MVPIFDETIGSPDAIASTRVNPNCSCQVRIRPALLTCTLGEQNTLHSAYIEANLDLGTYPIYSIFLILDSNVPLPTMINLISDLSADSFSNAPRSIVIPLFGSRFPTNNILSELSLDSLKLSRRI